MRALFRDAARVGFVAAFLEGEAFPLAAPAGTELVFSGEWFFFSGETFRVRTAGDLERERVMTPRSLAGALDIF
jgi:hypothetical protein